jgi:hypothetical protein
MARSLSVKVPTASVIALIEGKIAEIEVKIASYPADLKTYKEAYKAYKENILRIAVDAINSDPALLNDNDALSVGTSYRGDVQLTIDKSLITLPEEPVKPENPNDKVWLGREHANRLDLLKKNLAVLKMTQQEEINASTYSSVMDLL